MWMNGHEIDTLVDRFEDMHDVPNVRAGVLALDRYRDWVNRSSDGWPYWQLAARAADKLMTRLDEAQKQYRRGGLCEEITDAELKALLRPVRALIKKQDADPEEILFPAPLPVFRKGLTLTREQLEAWVGRTLTDDQVDEIDEAIPNSSIPEAIATIADFA
jgi:hypothetical protein